MYLIIGFLNAVNEFMIRNEDTPFLNKYKEKELFIIYIIHLFALEYLIENTNKLNEYIQENIDSLRYKSEGIEFANLLNKDARIMDAINDIYSSEEAIFKMLNYEDRLRVFDYFIKLTKYNVKNQEFVQEIKTMAIFLKCKRKDFEYLINKYEVNFYE